MAGHFDFGRFYLQWENTGTALLVLFSPVKGRQSIHFFLSQRREIFVSKLITAQIVISAIVTGIIIMIDNVILLFFR